MKAERCIPELRVVAKRLAVDSNGLNVGKGAGVKEFVLQNNA